MAMIENEASDSNPWTLMKYHVLEKFASDGRILTSFLLDAVFDFHVQFSSDGYGH